MSITLAQVPKARIYLVSDGEDDDQLVRAKTPAAALKHATRNITVKLASQDEIVTALGNGITVETAGEDAEEPQA